MIDLPKRETELRIEVGDGAALVLRPLNDAQYFALNETAQADAERVVFRLSAQPELFEQQLVRVEGVSADGEPLDAANPEHRARIPQVWKALALARLVRYAAGLTEGELGNSAPPAGSSPAAATPSPA